MQNVLPCVITPYIIALATNVTLPQKCCLLLQIRRSNVTVMQQSYFFFFLIQKGENQVRHSSWQMGSLSPTSSKLLWEEVGRATICTWRHFNG